VPELLNREEDLESFTLIASTIFAIFHLAMLLITPNVYHVRSSVFKETLPRKQCLELSKSVLENTLVTLSTARKFQTIAALQ
jgi:1,4-dihydroxy-2-naphthoate octaprenyltransferase